MSETYQKKSAYKTGVKVACMSCGCHHAEIVESHKHHSLDITDMIKFDLNDGMIHIAIKSP